MMFAKLSFMPRRTMISMVTIPAIKSGMRVSRTSPNRRSTIQSKIVIEPRAQRPAWKKARTTVRPDSRIAMGPPVAFGSTCCTARANCRRVSLSVGSQHRIEHGGKLLDGDKLGLLAAGNETFNGPYAGHLGQLGKLRQIRICCLLVRGKHIDRARPNGRIASQFEESGDRLNMGVSQIERIEIELEPVQQGQPGSDHERRADDDRNAAPLH